MTHDGHESSCPSHARQCGVAAGLPFACRPPIKLPPERTQRSRRKPLGSPPSEDDVHDPHSQKEWKPVPPPQKREVPRNGPQQTRGLPPLRPARLHCPGAPSVPVREVRESRLATLQ